MARFLSLIVLFGMLAPGAAWGQSAIPVYQSKSAVTLFSAKTSCGLTGGSNPVTGALEPEAGCSSIAYDVRNYGSVQISALWEGQAAGTVATDCATAYYQISGAASPTDNFAIAQVPGVFQGPVWQGATKYRRRTMTVPVVYPWLKIGVFTVAGDGTTNKCKVTLTATFAPLSEIVASIGQMPEGSALSTAYPLVIGGTEKTGYTVKALTLDASGRPIVVGGAAAGAAPAGSPVLMGGSDGAAVRTFRTDASGNLYTALATTGGSTETYSEMLVDSASATAVPTSATARSTTIQNIGPKAIYCGFTNAVTTLTGLKIDSGQGATFDTAAQPAMYCIGTVLQVAGAGTRVVLSDVPDTVRFYGGGGGGGGGASGVMGVSVPANVSLSANVSGAITGLTAEQLYRISCDAAASFRTGAATPTAVSTDSALFSNTVMDVKMKTGETCVAFLSGSSTVCRAALLTP